MQEQIDSFNKLGLFNPTGGGTYRLQSSIGSTDATIVLTSFKEPVSNIKYTMTYLNTDIMYATIEPGNNTRKEFVSFTTITQNSDGTASLGGVTRGLSFSTPFTASTTLRQTHAGASIFILSNSPQFYISEFPRLNNNSTTTGKWAFVSTSTPGYTRSMGLGADYASSSQLVSKAYVDGVSISGAADADESTKGISELATRAEIAAGTDLANPLVIQSTSATSTPGDNITDSGGTGQQYVIVSNTAGNLDPDWILRENYSLQGSTTELFAATTSIARGNATTTIQGKSFVIGTSTPGIFNSVVIASTTYFAKGVGIGISTTTSNTNLEVNGTIITNGLLVSGIASTTAFLRNFERISSADTGCNGATQCDETVTCSTGNEIISGGSATSITSAKLIASYSSSINVWTSSSACEGACGGYTLTAYAICADLIR